MESSHDPIASLVAHVDAVSSTAAGRRALTRWASRSPELSGYATAGGVAAAARAAGGGGQDRLVAAVLVVAAGDELAQLTVVACLAGRLRSVASGWARRGASRQDTEVMAGDLVAAAWEATAGLARRVAAGEAVPDRVALRLVDQAREAVRVPRRRERRAAARRCALGDLAGAAGEEPHPAADRLAVAIGDAVRQGRISRTAAAPVFLTRVAGFPVEEAAGRLGYSPAVLRAARSRTERRLAAA